MVSNICRTPERTEQAVDIVKVRARFLEPKVRESESGRERHVADAAVSVAHRGHACAALHPKSGQRAWQAKRLANSGNSNLPDCKLSS